jgi:hypothetical protein
VEAAGKQEVARLGAKEGYGFARLDGSAHHCATGAVDPAREVDGDHWTAASVDRLDHAPRVTGQRAVEPRAEKRVDDDTRPPQGLGLGGGDRTGPPARRLRGIALEQFKPPEQMQPDVVAALGKNPCRNEPVTAIVARTCHHHDRSTGWL